MNPYPVAQEIAQLVKCDSPVAVEQRVEFQPSSRASWLTVPKLGLW